MYEYRTSARDHVIEALLALAILVSGLVLMFQGELAELLGLGLSLLGVLWLWAMRFQRIASVRETGLRFGVRIFRSGGRVAWGPELPWDEILEIRHYPMAVIPTLLKNSSPQSDAKYYVYIVMVDRVILVNSGDDPWLFAKEAEAFWSAAKEEARRRDILVETAGTQGEYPGNLPAGLPVRTLAGANFGLVPHVVTPDRER